MKLKGNNLFEHIRVKVSLIEQSHVLDLIPAVAYPQLAYPPLLLNILWKPNLSGLYLWQEPHQQHAHPSNMGQVSL